MGFSNIVQTIVMALAAVITGIAVIRIGMNTFIKEAVTKATVVEKDTFSTRSYKPASVSRQYVITFDCGKKCIRFYTSVWVYDSVQIGEKGTLKYKGSTFISFDS